MSFSKNRMFALVCLLTPLILPNCSPTTSGSCQPGETKCKDDGSFQVCKADGSGWETTNCASDEQCANRACQKKEQPETKPETGPRCTANEKKCDGADKVLQCKADGSGWETTNCASDEQCANGACQKKPKPSTFGGMYYSFGQQCLPNPLTNACTCPAGFTKQDVTTNGQGGIEGGFGVCYKIPPVDFGGIAYGSGDCKVKNPYTGACTCPAGFEKRDLTTSKQPGFPGGFTVCYPKEETRFGGFFYQLADKCWKGNHGANPLAAEACKCPAGFKRKSFTGTKGFEGAFHLCYK